MSNISISFHKFRLRQKYRKEAVIELNTFKGKGIVQYLEEYVQENCIEINTEEVNGEKQQVFKRVDGAEIFASTNEAEEDKENVSDISDKYVLLYWNQYCQKTQKKATRDDFRFLHFMVLGGRTGDFKIIIDPNTGRVAFTQRPEYTGMNFFHVLIAVPCNPDATEGMILLEHKGINSMQTEFFKDIKNFHKDNDIIMDIVNIADYSVINGLIEKSQIEKLRLVKYYKDDDSSVKNPYEVEERIYTRPCIDNLKNLVKSMLKSGKCVGTHIAFIDNFEPQNVSVTLDLPNGKHKTYGINNVENVALVEFLDESDELEFDERREPTFESMETALLARFNQYRAVLKVTSS